MATMKDLAALLGVELGEEFRISDSRWLYKFDDNGLMHKNNEWAPFETQSVLCSLFVGRNEIIKLPWKPKLGDNYWYVGIDCEPINSRWKGIMTDHALYATGNCFRTENDAFDHREEVIACMKAIYENGREKQKSEKPSLEEALKALKEYCTGRACNHCRFCVDKENGEGCRLKDTPAIWPV